MSAGLAFAELHDGVVGSVCIRLGEVVLEFVRLGCFFGSSQAEVYDVRSCTGQLMISEVTAVHVGSALSRGVYVSEGRLLVDERVVELHEVNERRGRCRLELQLSDGAKLVVDGGAFGFRLESIGDVFEQWHGPIESSARHSESR